MRYGPPRNLWLYRTEAKNNSIKQFRNKNFINAPISLLLRNQLLCSYEHSSDNFLSQNREVKEGARVYFDEKHPMLKQDFRLITRRQNYEVYNTAQVIIYGLKYKKDAFILYEWPDNWPHFLGIEELYVNDEISMAVCSDYITEVYSGHFNAYEVKKVSHSTKLVVLEKLINKFPVAPYRNGDKIYVVNRFSHFCAGVP